MPKHLQGIEWAEAVEWLKADCLDPNSFRDALAGARAVVVSVGSPPVPFVDEKWQTMMNGGACAKLFCHSDLHATWTHYRDHLTLAVRRHELLGHQGLSRRGRAAIGSD